MNAKINIAEILKDFPRGMELDCLLYDNVTFISVDDDKNEIFTIKVSRSDGCEIYLTKYGQYECMDDAKCVIFPKGKTTWEGFHRPFKDGDIVAYDGEPYRNHLQIFIFKDKKENNTLSNCYLMLDGDELDLEEGMYYVTRFATEEEKQKLFDAIKDNGYKWNPETKTLEKLPRFKMWDKIRHKNDKTTINTICCIYDDSYRLSDGHLLFFKEQDQYELVPNKFDITTLVPFESRVLVRSSMDGLWKPAVFGFRNGYNDNAFYIVGGSCWKQCIPYLNNEHLCGTTNDCDDFYKTWE